MGAKRAYFTEHPVGAVYRNADSFFIIRSKGYDIVKEGKEFVPGEVKSITLLQLPRGVEFTYSYQKFIQAIKENRLAPFTPETIYVEF